MNNRISNPYRIVDPYSPHDERDTVFFCNCNNLKPELLQLARKILSETIEESKWQEFEAFAKEFPSMHPQLVCDVNTIYVVKSCEQELCSELVDRKELFRHKNKGLSTLLLNVITYHYLNYCHFYASNFLHYLELDVCFYNDFDIQHVMNGLHGRPEYMKLLSNFGYIPSMKGDSPRLMVITSYLLYDFIREDIDNASRIIPEFAADRIVILAKDIFFQNTFNEEQYRKRIYLATFCIEAVRYKLQMEEDEAKEYIRCLRMYFAATPDPLVTINEVRCMSYAYLHVLCNLQSFESYYEEFVKLMPECSAKLTPRNLTDLARCQIRESLGKCNLPLPAAVQQLTSSQSLRSFILGDVIDMSFKRGIASERDIITMCELEGLVFERESLQNPA